MKKLEMTSFFIRIVSNTLALYAAAWLVPGFAVLGGLREYALAGLVLAVLNSFVKPVLRIISLPLIILTLGLFSFIINAGFLYGLTYLFDFLTIEGLTALALATVVISAINVFFPHRD